MDAMEINHDTNMSGDFNPKCQHRNIKIKMKYLILKGLKRCIICHKRWCGARCSGCHKMIHKNCQKENYVNIQSSEINVKSNRIEEPVKKKMPTMNFENRNVSNMTHESFGVDVVQILEQEQSIINSSINNGKIYSTKDEYKCKEMHQLDDETVDDNQILEQEQPIINNSSIDNDDLYCTTDEDKCKETNPLDDKTVDMNHFSDEEGAEDYESSIINDESDWTDDDDESNEENRLDNETSECSGRNDGPNGDGSRPRMRIQESECEMINVIADVISQLLEDAYYEKHRIINIMKFYTHDRFQEHDFLISLNQRNVMDTALSILNKLTRVDLMGLGLSFNLIDSDECLILIRELCPNLHYLDLSNNELNNIDQLKHLKGLPLKILFLYGNPVFDLADGTQLTIEIQKIFPELIFLNNIKLQPLKERYYRHLTVSGATHPTKKKKRKE